MSKTIPIIAAAALAACASSALAAGWTTLSSQGMRHFVSVDAGAAAAGTQVFKDAAASLCQPKKPCVILFWSDANRAARKMPLSADQQKSLVAQYTRNPASGHEEVLLRCTGGEAAGVRCLK